MNNTDKLPRVRLGCMPTPFYKLEQISAKYGRNIYIKRDDLCGVALGGNKVRKLEYLLAEAKAMGCDTVYTTGGAQSNHAMLTAANAARLGMKCILILKKRGVTEEKGNIILNRIYGAEVRFMDTDSYDDIYAEIDKDIAKIAEEGRKGYSIPVGGSNPLGTLGYTNCVEEIKGQSEEMGIKIDKLVSATGSGGTTGGLLLGCKMYMPEVDVIGIDVGDEPFEEICPHLAKEAAEIIGADLPRREGDFRMIVHYGEAYAVPNPDDTPYILELARMEGILLDPIYTGKAFAGMMMAIEKGEIEGDNIVFVHTGGAAALFAVNLR